MLSADGDGPLEPRQEEFCRRRARGESQGAAYVGAGYKPANGTARKLGWRLEQRPRIKARIAVLKDIMGDPKVPKVVGPGRVIFGALRRDPPTKEYVLDTLVEITERCMQHHVLADAQGNPIKVPGPDGQMMCLLVGFRPKEATRAVELIGKELGMFVERLDATHRFEERYRTMTQAERMADAEALADEVRRLLGRQEQERIEAEATEAEAIEINDQPAEGVDAPPTPQNEPETAAPPKPIGLGALGLGVPDPRPNGGSDGGAEPGGPVQAPDEKD